jgi:outer membrane protein TolC
MVLGLSASQVIYSGGKVRAAIAAANAVRRSADLGALTARAQAVYQIAQAYFDAQVAERLLSIADSSFAQTERALQQTTLAREVGNTAEFDLIRARVQRDNERPAVLAARTQRDLAMLQLHQMLNLPADQPLVLTTSVDSAAGTATAESHLASNLVSTSPDTTVANRAIVKQAEENVHVQEQQLRSTRGQRLPQISLTSSYQRFAYPSGVFEDRIKMYFPNWTVSLGVSMPLFTGGRQAGDQIVAKANLAEAQQRALQARKSASYDARSAAVQLEQAQATLAASAGTDEQAARGYAIAEVRFNEGIGTQLDLTQARVDLERARANRVQASRDVALAQLKLALLQNLPLGLGNLTVNSTTGVLPAASTSITTNGIARQ